MSARTTHDITCDICGEHAGIEAESITEARRLALSEDGWMHRPLPTADGGTYPADICPECQAEGSGRPR